MNRLLSFIIFLTVFFALYGSLHFYFYWKLKNAIELTPICNVLIIIALCFLALSPVLMYALTHTGVSLWTRILAYVGFVWMGALFMFFWMNLVIDAYRGAIHILSRFVGPGSLKFIPGDGITLIFTLMIVTGMIIYGRFEADNIAVRRVVLKSSKLPPSVEDLRIVQISDIHFSTLNGKAFAQKIGRMIEELHPDILVSTGDLIDIGLDDPDGVVAVFRNIETRYGKFAITGNHEFISGIEEAVKFTEQAGFQMLRNKQIRINKFLSIAGVDDPAAKRYGIVSGVSMDEVLRPHSPGSINIFLRHRPQVDKESIGKVDLQLSGHTHNGQIFPFTLITSLFYPYHTGLFEVGPNSYLYVTRGTGTWGPPLRFLTFPEIVVIDVRRDELKLATDSEKRSER